MPYSGTSSEAVDRQSELVREAKDAQKNLLMTVRQLGAPRLTATVIFMLLAVLIARLSWQTPLIQDAEHALYDLRAAVFATAVEKESRIAMITFNEETLRLTGQRSPVDRTILAQALPIIDAAGPKAVGIDIFFDMPQDDDPAILTALESMKTPTFLAYANPKTNPEITFEQGQYLDGFFRSIANDKVRPTSIQVTPDSDDVARRWTRLSPKEPPFFAFALTGQPGDFANFGGSIRYAVPVSHDVPVFDKFPIENFADPEMGPALASFLKDKYVLIGGNFIDRDRFETPVGNIEGTSGDDRKMIGLEVHAHMLAQLLDGAKPQPIPTWALWVAAVLAMVAGALSALIIGRSYIVAGILASQLLFFLVLPFVLQKIGVETYELPGFGWGLGWLLAYASVGSAARTVGSKQRAFAQSALGKYLPKSIAQEILKDPDKLALHGEKRKIFAVFTDLEGFTKLSHAIEPEMVATLLNDYLDRLSDVALEYGGTIDKFVGDALVAFWGAPIAYPDDGERAVRAAYALYQAGEDFRKAVPAGVPPIGRTRVGVHYGEAIVGNFGGEGRIQYTALGDGMNTAARLEAANKPLGTKVLVSREAMERSGLDWFRPMGTITLRGRSTPVEIFEPVPDWDVETRQAVSEIIAAHSNGDKSAVQKLSEMIGRYREDMGLANLLERLKHTGKGESYALG